MKASSLLCTAQCSMIRIIVCSSRFLAVCELLHMVGAETLNPHECRERCVKPGDAAYRAVRLSPYNRFLEHFVSNEMKTKLRNGNFAYDETRTVVIVGGRHEILHSRLPLLS